MAGDEFYIGYLEGSAPAARRRVRQAVRFIFGFGALLALTLVSLQSPYSPAIFEFGTPREFVGWVQETPYPMLLVAAPGDASVQHALSRYTLVDSIKRGGHPHVAGLGGQLVRLRGELLYHEDQTMIVVQAGSVEPLGEGSPDAPAQSTEPLGRHTLVGEIVDSKCYFGVMKPGRGKPHRACAALCLRGGIPPVFAVEDTQGGSVHLLLVGADGEAVNSRVLDLVAEPVRITGEVVRHDNLLVMRADPAGYERLD